MAVALVILILIVSCAVSFFAVREAQTEATAAAAAASAAHATAEAAQQRAEIALAEAEAAATADAAAREMAETARAAAESQWLLLLSCRELTSGNNDVALILAIEAERAADTDEASAALREALAQLLGTPRALSGDVGVSMEDLLAEACRQAPRNLSQEEWQQFMGHDPYRETCPGKPVPTPDS